MEGVARMLVASDGVTRARAGTALVAALTACSSAPRPLTEADLRLLEQTGLDDPAVVAAIESVGGPVERFFGLDDGGRALPGPGVTVPVPASGVAETIVDVRDAIALLGYGVYLAEQNFGFEPDRMAIVVGDDPYDFLRLVRIDGINYDLEHEDVVERLRAWDQRYGLEYTGAGLDWVSAGFTTLPEWDQFAVEVYAFCPDVVDQGTETVEALARELRRSRSLYCWWD